VSAGRPQAASPPEADVLVADDETLAVAVQTADCVPLLLADPRTGAVAAVHAGWRGLAARAPVVALQAMAAQYGARSHDVLAAFGPSIGACCYEVGPDVRSRFAASGVAADAIERWFLEKPVVLPGNPPMPGVRRDRREGRWYFDGWSVVRTQLEDAGVDPGRIFGPNLCTGSHPGVFCSFRRDGAGAGRMAAAIRVRGDRTPFGVRSPRP
jgi:YfiH family protein